MATLATMDRHEAAYGIDLLDVADLDLDIREYPEEWHDHVGRLDRAEMMSASRGCPRVVSRT